MVTITKVIKTLFIFAYMDELFKSNTKTEQQIAEKIFNNSRISVEDANYLFSHSSLAFCAYLADHIRKKRFGNNVFFNKNTHLEITNRCINKCKFCSFYREKGDPECWDLEINDVLHILKDSKLNDITEVHITGGLHPDKTTKFYCELFSEIKKVFPKIHIKAFTAVEIEYFAKTNNCSSLETIHELKEFGLNSLAGGGAEILNNNIRRTICPEKTNAETWLRIHNEAHTLGLSTNSTMLFGHIESFSDRVDHMNKLRILQDETNGFNCFIPLKYKVFGNDLNVETETSLLDELKTYAISRIFLDNIPHLKAYWPMCGKENASLFLSFGADDIDGTISNSTRIYSMAGSKEQKPDMSETEIRELIKNVGFIPVERNSVYEIIKH